MLFQFFISKYAKEIGKPVTGLTRQAERRLLDYSYPGNVRELSNIIEYAICDVRRGYDRCQPPPRKPSAAYDTRFQRFDVSLE